MVKTRVTAVSYLNTVPLLFGIKNSEVMEAIDLRIAPPAQCARELENGDTDLALIPVAALSNIPHHNIVSNYCIGATGKVRTVALLSNDRVGDIHTVYLDTESRTSVQLARVLSKHYWQTAPTFKPYVEQSNILRGEACVLIGDKVFAHENRFTYRYDLAEQWINFTGLPFVFAAWATTTSLSSNFITSFNKALNFGVRHISEALTEPLPCSRETALEYLNSNISYSFDAAKENGLRKFREFLLLSL